MNTYHVEYTDTFSGEANYSWVKRHEIQAANMAQAFRKGKKLVGLNGVRGTVQNFGDGLQFVPFRSCTILFIS